MMLSPITWDTPPKKKNKNQPNNNKNPMDSLRNGTKPYLSSFNLYLSKISSHRLKSHQHSHYFICTYVKRTKKKKEKWEVTYLLIYSTQSMLSDEHVDKIVIQRDRSMLSHSCHSGRRGVVFMLPLICFMASHKAHEIQASMSSYFT